MTQGRFAWGTALTFTTGVLSLLMGVGASVILARVLGPEERGIYALAVLLPSLIVTFSNFGIGPAIVYYVARGEFRRQDILGNSVWLSLTIGTVGVVAGLLVVVFVRRTAFPGVPLSYLLLAVVLVPAEMFSAHIRYVLLGAQRIKEFNCVQIAQSCIFLASIGIALLVLRSGVRGAILAGVTTWLLVDVLVFHWAREAAGGVDFGPNITYVKQAAVYGLQAYLANILGFLNYRVDMFLVNGFLGPAAVGPYAVGVELVERLWMMSQAASTVLFPRVAGETVEQERKEFTPVVARTVLWTTAVGALVLAVLSRPIVLLLYSEAFLQVVGALQALLVGVVALGVGRVLSNDIAGRGLPRLNIYGGLAAVMTNLALNIWWIPRYGIIGAAWASTVSYTISFMVALFFYCRLSSNHWTKVVLPQRGDWVLYWKIVKALCRWACGRVRAVL